jgi:glucokinase
MVESQNTNNKSLILIGDIGGTNYRMQVHKLEDSQYTKIGDK